MRCPDCSAIGATRLYQIGAGRLVLTALSTLIVALLGAVIVYSIGFFVFFLGPMYGVAVAEVALRVSGRKRGRIIEAIGVGSIVAGAVIVIWFEILPILHLAAHGRSITGGDVLAAFGGLAWPLIGVGLAVASCFSKLRYY